jgi:hypothetical protein
MVAGGGVACSRRRPVAPGTRRVVLILGNIGGTRSRGRGGRRPRGVAPTSCWPWAGLAPWFLVAGPGHDRPGLTSGPAGGGRRPVPVRVVGHGVVVRVAGGHDPVGTSSADPVARRRTSVAATSAPAVPQANGVSRRDRRPCHPGRVGAVSNLGDTPGVVPRLRVERSRRRGPRGRLAGTRHPPPGGQALAPRVVLNSPFGPRRPPEVIARPVDVRDGGTAAACHGRDCLDDDGDLSAGRRGLPSAVRRGPRPAGPAIARLTGWCGGGGVNRAVARVTSVSHHGAPSLIGEAHPDGTEAMPTRPRRAVGRCDVVPEPALRIAPRVRSRASSRTRAARS